MNHKYTGWLSPDGEMFYCDFHEHLKIADDIIVQYKYDHVANTTPDKILIDHGWIHVTFKTIFEHGYDFEWKYKPTYAQKYFMKPIFEDPDVLITESCRYRFEHFA